MPQSPYILETSRLQLREITVEDAETMYALNADPEVIKYTGDDAFKDIDAARDFLQKYESYRRYGFGRWAVERKQDGKVLGWCGLKFDVEKQEHDIGFRFFRAYWGMGFATEAAAACITHGFAQHAMPFIVGRAMAANAASIRVLEKSGMQFSRQESDEHLWQVYIKYPHEL